MILSIMFAQELKKSIYLIFKVFFSVTNRIFLILGYNHNMKLVVKCDRLFSKNVGLNDHVNLISKF